MAAPTAAEAADRIASLRRTMLSTLPMHTEELLAREVSVTTPDEDGAA